eukprot:scaffold3319_cov258-Pinguiococcus_pyrenoidosus.AAC.2
MPMLRPTRTRVPKKMSSASAAASLRGPTLMSSYSKQVCSPSSTMHSLVLKKRVLYVMPPGEEQARALSSSPQRWQPAAAAEGTSISIEKSHRTCRHGALHTSAPSSKKASASRTGKLLRNRSSPIVASLRSAPGARQKQRVQESTAKTKCRSTVSPTKTLCFWRRRQAERDSVPPAENGSCFRELLKELHRHSWSCRSSCIHTVSATYSRNWEGALMSPMFIGEDLPAKAYSCYLRSRTWDCPD